MVNSNCDKHQFVSDLCGVDVVKVLATLAQVGARHRPTSLHGKIQYLAPGLDPTTRIL
jgi:hypothetical protein